MNAYPTKKSGENLYALIVPTINHPFFSNIADQLSMLAHKKGCLFTVFQSNEDSQLEQKIIDTLIEQKFAGVIASIAKTTKTGHSYNRLKEAGIPLVFFDRACDDILVPKVLINNYEITRSVTEQLIEKGYKRIALINGTNDINVFRERQRGYSDALEKHHLTYRMPIFENEFSVEKGKEVFIKLWGSTERPDAIISASLQLTLGILTQTNLFNIRIPQKLNLISFVNHITFKMIQPKITIIDQPEIEMAKAAFHFLERMIQNELIPENEMIHVVNAYVSF